MARWRQDGKEIVFTDGDGKFYSVEVRENGGAIEFGPPILLFTTRVSRLSSNRYFAMSGDGQRFVTLLPRSDSTASTPVLDTLNVSVDWMPGLKRP